MSQQVDERIVNKIHQFVNEGVCDVKNFVKNELFHDTYLPSPISRRYHMHIATVKLKFLKIDQENLELKFKEWQKQSPNDNFFFRGYGSIHERSLEPDKLGTDDKGSDEVRVSSIFETYFNIRSFRSTNYQISSTIQVFKCC